MSGRVVIERLRVRAAVDPPAAATYGEAIARALAERLAAAPPRAAAKVRLRLPAGAADPATVAERIARSLR